MWDFAAKAERVPGPHHVGVLAVTVFDPALEDVKKFDSGMLESLEHLAFVRENHQKRLEKPSRTAIGGGQMIGVTLAGAPPHHLHPLALLDELGAALLGRVALKDGADRNPERTRQAEKVSMLAELWPFSILLNMPLLIPANLATSAMTRFCDSRMRFRLEPIWRARARFACAPWTWASVCCAGTPRLADAFLAMRLSYRTAALLLVTQLCFI